MRLFSICIAGSSLTDLQRDPNNFQTDLHAAFNLVFSINRIVKIWLMVPLSTISSNHVVVGLGFFIFLFHSIYFSMISRLSYFFILGLMPQLLAVLNSLTYINLE